MVVYIREAHAMDSHLPMTFGNIEDPVHFEERAELARFASESLGLTMPAVVDGIDDTVNSAYQAWPERLYLVGTDGTVLFRCGPGPFGFDPDGLGEAIEKMLAEPEPISLFDGASLSGWECFLRDDAALEDVWSVEDGVLVCKGEPGGYLRTADKYEDFQLVVEWRWPEEPGNSGVLLRVGGDEEQMLPPCAEAQLRHGSAGVMYGFQDYRISGPAERLSEIGLPGWKLDRMSDAENPAGEWNRYVITARGDRIELELNGVVVNSATECGQRAGKIGLQSEGGVIEFRRVELLPID